MIVQVGCAGPTRLTRYEFTRQAMGGRAEIVLYARTRDEAVAAAGDAFERIQHLDSVLSDYRAQSELMRVCERAGTGPVRASDDLIAVLRVAETISRASDGAFDVTVGPIVRLWRRSGRDGRLPDRDELAAAMSRVGWQKVQIDPSARTVSLAVAGMRLDLGGIGKGFAADEALAELKRHGLSRSLVNLGGDIAVGDPPPGETGWRIVPAWFVDDPPGQPLLIANAGVAGSGDAERFVEVDGVRYSHIVDPRTGIGLTHRTAVVVIASDGTTADALASAASVLGPERGAELVERLGGRAIFRRIGADPP
ncbi:MAG: FAD:protein FMN transferase [Planctomycetes bacterium]|nr:FAD:protein FMN transferase [Planctomycetota bacterium]